MIIPCIDLMGGKAVQLVGGREKVLEEDPREMLERFSAYPMIHVIDLDAALGKGDNSNLAEELAKDRPCRVGGGIRTVERARHLISLGAEQVIVSSAIFGSGAVDYQFLDDLVATLSREKMCIAIDLREDRVQIHGWQESIDLKAVDLIPILTPYCKTFLCTDVDREGRMKGANLELFCQFARMTSNDFVAAGGITTMDEVQALEENGIDAAVGMAIYRGLIHAQS